VLLAIAGTACSKGPKPSDQGEARQEGGAGGKKDGRPRDLTVDLGGGVKMEFVLIPAGSFMMGDEKGSDRQKPAHKVTITKPFYLGKYEVTQEQWQAMMGTNPSYLKGPKNPVECVSWKDCQAFLAKLNEKLRADGAKFGLPTEAQWEYACRAGTTTIFSFGDDPKNFGDYAWYGRNSDQKTHPVGQKKPNVWGLYDMHGNVCEWCDDWYAWDYYRRSPVEDPLCPDWRPSGVLASSYSAATRVLRGGSRYDGAPVGCADREGDHPEFRFPNHYGFRVAKTVEGAATQPEFSWPEGVPRDLTVDLDGGVNMEFVLIPAGSFMMGDEKGDSGEKPVHKVTITKPFYFGKYEVTQEQWQAVMGSNPSYFKGPKNPVEKVSWEDCQKFVAKLDEKSRSGGAKFGLPTEAQWEYACRAGTTTSYSFGDDPKNIGDYAWSGGKSARKTHPVGQKKPNPWGLYDMHGNVWEWCADRAALWYYDHSPANDPVGPSFGDSRVLRGGSYDDPRPDLFRCAYRANSSRFIALRHVDCVGCRVARTLAP
jgi:formylglycine-generating enzyme required for sulfatase activity